MRNKEAAARHHRLIYLLNVAQRRLQRWMAAQPQNEVTPAQAGLLFILGKQDGVLMGEAGAALDHGAGRHFRPRRSHVLRRGWSSGGPIARTAGPGAYG